MDDAALVGVCSAPAICVHGRSTRFNGQPV